MNVEFFDVIEPGECFITYINDGENISMGWLARLISPTAEHNAVSIDNGALYYLEDICPVVRETES